MRLSRSLLAVFAATAFACGANETKKGSKSAPGEIATEENAAASDPAAGEATETPSTGAGADVVAVAVSGAPGRYTFAVTLKSPDAGCERYANWWEVVTPAGELIYRRILAHSHVDEQPFERSGGPVDIAAEDEVIVRAHMDPGGYGGAALRGTPTGPFVADPSIDAGFAAALETTEPQPSGCAF